MLRSHLRFGEYFISGGEIPLMVSVWYSSKMGLSRCLALLLHPSNKETLKEPILLSSRPTPGSNGPEREGRDTQWLTVESGPGPNPTF